MKRIILVRHATTEFNKKGLIQGQKDSSLAKESEEEINFICNKIKNIDFDILISSDLSRCKKTAKKISKIISLNKKLILDPRIREVCSGDYTLKSKIEMMKKDPYFKKDIKYVPPGGESYDQMINRVKMFYRDLKNKNFKNALVVTHAGCIRALISIIMNINYDFNMKVSNRFIGRIIIDKNNQKYLNINP